eukprot:SAG31_NODE_43034_length_269_cov_0.558824_2_plen_36_part_01
MTKSVLVRAEGALIHDAITNNARAAYCRAREPREHA